MKSSLISLFSHVLFPRHVIQNNSVLLPLVKKRCECQRILHFSMRRKDYVFPELKDEDLEEDFVRGSGPGGQSVNKTSNCVVLKHKPTGIVVKCHETRSLHENRTIARLRLQEKIDCHVLGSESFLALQRSEAKSDKAEKKRKSKEKLERKKAFKEREGLD